MHRNQILFHRLLNLEMLEVITIPEDHSRAPSDLSCWFNCTPAGSVAVRCFGMQMVVSDRTKPSSEQIDDGVSY